MYPWNVKVIVMRGRRTPLSWILGSTLAVLLGMGLCLVPASAHAAQPSARAGVAAADDPAPEPEPEPQPLPLPPILQPPPKATPTPTPKAAPAPKAAPSKKKSTSKKSNKKSNKKKANKKRGASAPAEAASATPALFATAVAPAAKPKAKKSTKPAPPSKVGKNPQVVKLAALPMADALPQAALRSAQTASAQQAASALPLWVPAAFFGLAGLIFVPVLLRRRQADPRSW